MTAGSPTLWVDTDMGFDDMHALLVLRHQGIKPVAQSLVFGCTPLPQVAKNAQEFDGFFDWGHPWHVGSPCSLDGSTRTAEHVLGLTGLLTRGMTLPQALSLPETPKAIAALIDWLSSDPDQPEILALGPLTNIAQLCLQAPELVKRLKRLTWMGGSTGRGNQTAYSEFNAWADARAAATVFKSGIPIRMVDLEICRQVQLVPEDLLPLAQLTSPRARLLHDLLGGYLDIGLSRGRGGMALYDPVAAAAIVASDAFDIAPVNIRVETQDPEREGQTLVSHRDNILTQHSVLKIIDAPSVKSMILEALLTAALAEDNSE